MDRRRWRVLIGSLASEDLDNIVRWTVVQFGGRQARLYDETIRLAIRALADGPNVGGSRSRDEVGLGFRTLHVARAGRRGRHLLLYRVADRGVIEIVRILHDRMDLPRHVAGPESEDRP